MRGFSLICLLLTMMACSYGERAEWDSGAKAKGAYQEEARQQEEEAVQDQLPTSDAGTETPQPF